MIAISHERIRQRLSAVLITLCLPVGTARAAPTPEAPSSRQEVAAALRKVGTEYGRDAVRLQSHLLQNSLEGGSLQPASVGVAGFEQAQQKKLMVVNLETGIVYNDDRGKPQEYPANVWRTVVEPTLRQFTSLEIPADGIELRVGYQHALYSGRDEIPRLAEAGALSSDLLTLHLPTGDILGLAGGSLAPAEVVARAGATLNGTPVRIDLGPDGNRLPPAPPTASRALVPETDD